IASLALDSSGNVLAGGRFVQIGGIVSPNIARLWRNSPACIESLSRPNDGSSTLKLRLPVASTNRVQFKTNLNDAAWMDLPGDLTMSRSNSRTNKIDSTVGDSKQRFYRVKQL